MQVHHPGGPRGLHRLRLCVSVCPAKDKTDPKHKAIDMAPQAPAARAEEENFEFFLDLPDSTAPTSVLTMKTQLSS